MPKDTPSSRATSGHSRRVESVGVGLILIVAAWFYTWTATSAGSPLTFELQKDDLYNRLTDGFLAGQTSFAELPPPELARLANPYDPAQNAPYQRYHDVSYYKGRYYLYFGPTPAVMLLAPWKVLTGQYLPQNLAVAVFAWGATLLSVMLMLELRRRHLPQAKSWVVVLGAVVICFGNLLPILLRRPVYYELAIASACFFGLAALRLLHKALNTPARQNWWLAGASACLGLAVTARPNYLFGAAAALGVFFWRQWQREQPNTPETRRRYTSTVAAAVWPAALAVAGLLVYNQERFGGFAEFGTRYMLAGGNQQNLVMMSLRFVPINLYYYLLAPPQFSVYFPFFQVTGFPPITPPAGYSGIENMYGLAASLPFVLTLCWLRRYLQARSPAAEPLRELVWCGLALAGGNAAFLLLITGANNRYLIDFAPVLLPLATLAVMDWEHRATGWRRLGGRLLWTAALAYTLVFNFFGSLQHNELLRFHNPATYRKLAHAFNHWSEWYARMAGAESGPLRVELKLPQGRTGKLEPLVVTGLSFRADFLYLFYKDDRHIQIGFEHTSYGGPLSAPIAVDYDAPHVLEAHMGSFYPPVEHPCYDGMPPGEIERRKRTLLVKLDGRVVLSAQCDFYDSSPGDVAVGRNPVSEAFGRRFTGQVKKVERIPEN